METATAGSEATHSSAFVAVVTVLTLYIVYQITNWIDRRKKWIDQVNKLPGPKIETLHPWLSGLSLLTEKDEVSGGLKVYDGLAKVQRQYEKEGVCNIWAFNPYRVPFARANVQIIDADFVRQLLTDKEYSSCIIKDPRIFDEIMKPFLGNGLLVYHDTPQWKSQRKIISQGFRQDFLEHASKICTEKLYEHVFPAWDKKNTAQDMHDWTLRFTQEIIGLSVLSHSFGGFEDGDTLYQACRDLSGVINRRIVSHPALYWLQPEDIKMSKSHMARVHAYLKPIIDERVEAQLNGTTEKKGYRDLLSYLVMPGEDGKIMEYKYILGNVLGLLLAGHDTTAAVLAYGMWHLAFNVKAQKKLQDEVDELMKKYPKEGEYPAYKEYMKLPYLDAVVKESLRLAAPGPVSREVVKEFTLKKNGKEFTIPVGSKLLMIPRVFHCNEEVAKTDCFDFKPERFLESKEETARLNKYMMPFSIGPRYCVGMPLALVELKVCLAQIMYNYSIKRNPNAIEPVPLMTVTISPHEVLMDVERRKR